MPFIPNTPESLLRRADSKNPASTCKGITTSGIHCRRSITNPRSSFTFLHQKPKKDHDGVLAVLEPGEGFDEGAAAFFCWQHKDQAASLTNAPHGNRLASIVELKRRTSQDTLVERLGMLSVDGDGKSRSKRPSRRNLEKEKPARKETLPKKWQDVDGPLLAVHEKRGQTNRRPRRRNDAGLLFALCCLKMPDIEEEPPVRPHRYSEKANISGSASHNDRSSAPPPKRTAYVANPKPQTRKRAYHADSNRQTTPNPMTPTHRPRSTRDPPSETQTLLSLVPKTLSPQTTSLLLAELAKPISPHDEPGYIYIFWLTPSTNTKPDDAEISHLLDKPSASTLPVTSKHERQQTRSSGPTTATNPKTILLKIGRASNVQRRMNEWSRQCNYNLSLIRFYPYVPTSSSPSSPSIPNKPSPSRRPNIHLAPPSSPTKVPHAQKVERLIHLELADLRVRRDCEACGRCHQEWFEVGNSREGVRGVDEVVKRWVGWGERGRR